MGNEERLQISKNEERNPNFVLPQKFKRVPRSSFQQMERIPERVPERLWVIPTFELKRIFTEILCISNETSMSFLKHIFYIAKFPVLFF